MNPDFFESEFPKSTWQRKITDCQISSYIIMNLLGKRENEGCKFDVAEALRSGNFNATKDMTEQVLHTLVAGLWIFRCSFSFKASTGSTSSMSQLL